MSSRFHDSSLRQSYAAIFLSILTDVLAGFFLGSAEATLRLLPGLVVLVPAALGMRGQIFASLGSRLGSALHMGTIKLSRKNKPLRNNIYASMALTIIFSVFLGMLAKFVLLAFGMASISLIDLILISLIGGILSGVIMLALTLVIAFASFRKGWDPDNVSSPMITALGDFFTVPTLLLAASLVTSFAFSSSTSIIIVASGLALLVFLDIFSVESRKESARLREFSYRQIVIQSSMILVFTLFLDAISGIVIQSNLNALLAVPLLLVILPAFLEEGGNIGNVMASRLSTKLHMGVIEAKMKITSSVRQEFLNSYLLSFLIFASVAVVSFAFSLMTGIGGIGFYQLFLITVVAGFLLSTIIIFITFMVSIVSFRLNIDPDNISIPIITSIADVLGVFCLLVVLHGTGII
jgi:mgtE-like transporter